MKDPKSYAQSKYYSSKKNVDPLLEFEQQQLDEKARQELDPIASLLGIDIE